MAISPPKNTLDELRIERPVAAARRSKSGLALVALAAVAVLGAGGWWFARTDAVEVRTVMVRESVSPSGGGSGRTVLNASGYVTARRQATVSSKVTGKVIEVLVEEGKRVQEGDWKSTRLNSSHIPL